MLDKLASLKKEDGKENFNYHWLYLSTNKKKRLTQERVGWLANFKNERKQRGSRKSRTCRIGKVTASHTQLVKDKNKILSKKGLLEFSLTERTKSKACLTV